MLFRSAFVAEFVGTMNHLPGELVGDGMVRVEDQTLRVDGTPAASGSVSVLVRPEAVVVQADAGGRSVVQVATFRGATTRLRLVRDDESIVLADVPSHRAADLGVGQRVAISLLDRPVLLAGS